MLRWSIIKRLVGSKLVRLIAVVPFVGWFLVLDDTFAALLYQLTGLPDLARPGWQIYAFHVGLSIAGTGVTIFYLFCPSEIKNYDDVNSFIATELHTLTAERLDSFAKYLQPRIGLPPEDPLLDAPFRDAWVRQHLDTIHTILHRYYEQTDTTALNTHLLYRVSQIGTKYLCLVLILVGFGLAMAPSLTTLAWSLRRLREVTIG